MKNKIGVFFAVVPIKKISVQKKTNKHIQPEKKLELVKAIRYKHSTINKYKKKIREKKSQSFSKSNGVINQI